jgi:hypothetical protein
MSSRKGIFVEEVLAVINGHVWEKIPLDEGTGGVADRKEQPWNIFMTDPLQ